MRRDPVAAFRGQGKGGAVKRLLAERKADRVAELLNQAQAGRTECYGCFMSLMEVYYRVWKDEGEAAAAGLAGATLVHKAPEFAALKLKQDVLPLK